MKVPSNENEHYEIKPVLCVGPEHIIEITVEGLAVNTTYIFRTKAKNFKMPFVEQEVFDLVARNCTVERVDDID